ncbi:MAG: putative integral rane protein [Sphingomonas bacterium]|uniref:hypothetical protein n=1 Tax=Sphingomonas bacterium TaxID=1895847 RepID=UPI002609B283|nr:hypothetical protein [Sphingomonas bacterium]MDB5707261.1 putative integral rane protein [Sphingomonas bacterium]
MATSVASTTDRMVSIGRVFSRAFATMASNPLTVFGISFLFGALPGVIMNYVAQNLGYSQQNLATGAITPLYFYTIFAVIIILGIVFAMLTQGALVRATVAHSEGRNASFGESAMAGLQVALPLFVLGILLGLGVTLGFLLLIVPGIILYLMWAVAAPALVEEQAGVFEAFGRSRYLTKGARWKILALGLIMLVIYWIFSAVAGVALVTIYGVQGLAAAVQQGLPLTWLAVSAVISTILTAIIATIQTSLYIELRDWKDGPGSEALSEVFA